MRPTLEITTKIGCVNKCVYCPQQVLISGYTGNLIMPLTHFKRILEHTPRNIQIDFTGFCEPFLNPWASMMMRYSIEQGYDTVLITTLSGFTRKDANIISGLRFQDVMIHEYEGTPINYEVFEKKAIWLQEAVVTDHFERFKLRKEDRWSRAGNLFDREARSGRFECGWTGRDFSRNVVLPNGDVCVCCMDYGLKHKLGNMYKTHYNDLNRKQIVDLTTEEYSDVICRKCEMFKKVD